MAYNQVTAASKCLYSSVRNVLSRSAYFGFLPPHGRRLAAGEEITIFGDIQSHLNKGTPNGRGRRSLETALSISASGGEKLAITRSPSVYLVDATTAETKVIALNDGSFATADPCWGSYSSHALSGPDGDY